MNCCFLAPEVSQKFPMPVPANAAAVLAAVVVVVGGDVVVFF